MNTSAQIRTMTDVELLRLAQGSESRIVAELAARVDNLRCVLDQVREIALNLDDYPAPNACDEIANLVNATL